MITNIKNKLRIKFNMIFHKNLNISINYYTFAIQKISLIEIKNNILDHYTFSKVLIVIKDYYTIKYNY